MRPDELLHQVNNQLQIIVGTAHLLLDSSDLRLTKAYREDITAAAFRVSAILTAYCDVSEHPFESLRLELPGQPGNSNTR